MEVGIKVLAENIHTRAIRHVNSCFFTMVAVEANGTPAVVQPLSPGSEEEKRRFGAAQERRRFREQLQSQ